MRSDNGIAVIRMPPCPALVKRARETGFNLERSELLALYRDEHRTSAQVKKLAQEKIVDLRSRIAGLQAAQRPGGGGELLSGDANPSAPSSTSWRRKVRRGCAIRPCRKGSVGACARGRAEWQLIAVD